MAKKSVRNAKEKKDTPKKAGGSVRGFSFNFSDGDERTLFVMPFAKPVITQSFPTPKQQKQMHDLLEKELAVAYPENYGHLGSKVRAAQKAYDEGRAMFRGWSPWRAKDRSLSWKDWDAFCAKWLECDPRLDSRPAGKYGEDKSASVQAFAEEVAALVAARKLKLLDDYPFGFKKSKL